MIRGGENGMEEDVERKGVWLDKILLELMEYCIGWELVDMIASCV